MHVDFSKPETSIINKDLLALNGVKPFQKEMRYLDFDVDISMFHQYVILHFGAHLNHV